MRSIAATSFVVLLAGSAAFAQDQVTMRDNQLVQQKRIAEASARVPFDTPIKGAPYSADVIVSSSQTLADGNHISRQETSHVARDGEGRTRREQSGRMSVVSSGQPVVSTTGTIVSIVDPIAGYSYSLDEEHKIAWRTPIGTSKVVLDKVQAAGAARSSEPMTEEQKANLEKAKVALAAQLAAAKEGNEAKAGGLVVARRDGGVVGMAYVNDMAPLEHATIDGLAVEGHKTSETIPAGKIGNELPITVTNEEWTSTDLKVLVLTKHNDPRTGESNYRLTNVVRAEPDPSLFLVPPDYTVKDTGIRRNNE